jgi:hypothetical protein
LTGSEIPCSRSFVSEDVVGVGKPTQAKRQAAATDAAGQLITEQLELVYALIQVSAPRCRQACPVVSGGRSLCRERVEGGFDPGQRYPDALRRAYEGHSPEHLARIATLIAGSSTRGDEALGFIEAQRGNRYAAPVRQVADAQLSSLGRYLHLRSLTSI